MWAFENWHIWATLLKYLSGHSKFKPCTAYFWTIQQKALRLKIVWDEKMLEVNISRIQYAHWTGITPIHWLFNIWTLALICGVIYSLISSYLQLVGVKCVLLRIAIFIYTRWLQIEAISTKQKNQARIQDTKAYAISTNIE